MRQLTSSQARLSDMPVGNGNFKLPTLASGQLFLLFFALLPSSASLSSSSDHAKSSPATLTEQSSTATPAPSSTSIQTCQEDKLNYEQSICTHPLRLRKPVARTLNLDEHAFLPYWMPQTVCEPDETSTGA